MLSLLPTAILLRSTVGYPRDLWVDYTVINQGFLWMEVFIKGRPHDTVIVYTYSILLKKVVQVGPSSTKNQLDKSLPPQISAYFSSPISLTRNSRFPPCSKNACRLLNSSSENGSLGAPNKSKSTFFILS